MLAMVKSYFRAKKKKVSSPAYESLHPFIVLYLTVQSQILWPSFNKVYTREQAANATMSHLQRTLVGRLQDNQH